MEKYSAFTLKSTIILDMLKTDAVIDSKIRDVTKVYTPHTWRGLWDTGASRSSIDKRVANEMVLQPIGLANISTANGVVSVNTYLIDLTLPNNVTVHDVIVSGADLGGDIDLLIGMDIIRHGDFAITNTNGSTTFSFRIPSLKEIDYVKEYNDNVIATDINELK